MCLRSCNQLIAYSIRPIHCFIIKFEATCSLDSRQHNLTVINQVYYVSNLQTKIIFFYRGGLVPQPRGPPMAGLNAMQSQPMVSHFYNACLLREAYMKIIMSPFYFEKFEVGF